MTCNAELRLHLDIINKEGKKNVSIRATLGFNILPHVQKDVKCNTHTVIHIHKEEQDNKINIHSQTNGDEFCLDINCLQRRSTWTRTTARAKERERERKREEIKLTVIKFDLNWKATSGWPQFTYGGRTLNQLNVIQSEHQWWPGTVGVGGREAEQRRTGNLFIITIT